MNKLIFFLLIHFPVLLFGQDLRKVKDRNSNETFFVLKSDGSTRHGEYKKFGYHDRLLLKGYDRQGSKTASGKPTARTGNWRCSTILPMLSCFITNCRKEESIKS